MIICPVVFVRKSCSDMWEIRKSEVYDFMGVVFKTIDIKD
jgi:hypothetical protein